MILTGSAIEREVRLGNIVIDPYDPRHLEPNSYGFHIGPNIIRYVDPIIDARSKPTSTFFTIPKEGYCLEPGRFYLGSTLETMGSYHHAATLYARRSTSTMGMWIQFSAPLGHTGAIIPWTLEITVTHPIIVYPGMLIGKIAFWEPQGLLNLYKGKYTGSRDVVASRMVEEMRQEP
jgi:dCTP deaminase